MKYLTPQQVLAIHDQMIKRFGGSNGLRDLGLLESAINRPMATFGGNDLYENIFDKAAALLQSLLKNHPFIDGNKRTALTSTGIFLKQNGIRLKNYHEDEVEFAVSIDNEHLSLKEISSWVTKHSIDTKLQK